MSMMEYYEQKQEYDNKNVNKRACQKMDNMGEWISIEDRLPKECEDILLYAEWETAGISDISKSSGIKIGWYINGHWHIDNRCRVRAKYWMPLPEPPKEK